MLNIKILLKLKIEDKEKFKYMVMKRTIEDYLLYLKKAMEKNLISFEECKKKQEKYLKNYFLLIISLIREKNNYINLKRHLY